MQNSENTESNKIIVDTYAWVEYFKGSEEGLKAKKFIEGDFNLYTPSVVVAELSDKYNKEKNIEWDSRLRFIKIKSEIIELTSDIADKAGELKQELRKKHKNVGLGDAMILSHAKTIEAKILTGDKHFTDLKSSIDIKK